MRDCSYYGLDLFGAIMAKNVFDEKQRYIMKGMNIHYYVYMLRTSANTLYVGQTNNLKKRLHEHKSKGPKAAKYMKYFETFELVYTEVYPTRSKAMQREWELKHWTKKEKEALIAASK